MRKTVLFIAVSLDGYIADGQNSVEWIKGQDEDVDMVDTYSLFIKDVDTIIMGRRTYNQIVNELSPSVWPYSGMISYVITHHIDREDSADIKFIDSDPSVLIEQLKQEEGKNIWICGGASIINQLAKDNLIDVYHLTIIPVLLGNGVRLFESSENTIELRLVKTMDYNGIVELVYCKR